MNEQSSLNDFVNGADTESDLYECEICGRTFDSNKGRGIHIGNSHSEKEIKEAMITELQRLANSLGTTPGLREMDQHGSFGSKTYQDKFGSWNEAILQAGLTPNQGHNIPKEDLLDELKRLSDELGRTPTSRDMKESGCYGDSVFVNTFGSWNNAVTEAGLEPTRQRDVPREELLNELKRLTEELGDPPRVDEMRDLGAFGVSTYSNEFGSWNAALLEAGLSLNKQVGIPESDLLGEIQRLHQELGRVPSAFDMENDGNFAVNTYRRKFGSWNQALSEAGLELNNRTNIPQSELLNEIKRLADEIDRVPTIGDMEQIGRFGSATYAKSFESWNEAIRRAGFEPNVRSDIPESELKQEILRLNDELGYTPERREMDRFGQFDSSTYASSFGTWNKALQEVELTPNERRDIPKSELLAELQRLADELGRTPIRDEMGQQGEFSHSVYTNRFGSWNNAIIEAGLDPNKILEPDHLDHIVRSTWELEIADLLLDAGVDYEYESLEIIYGEGRTYTPDFVTDQYVIEVKGHIYSNEVQKARAAMEHLNERDYVAVGTELPADIHISLENRAALHRLFE